MCMLTSFVEFSTNMGRLRTFQLFPSLRLLLLLAVINGGKAGDDDGPHHVPMTGHYNFDDPPFPTEPPAKDPNICPEKTDNSDLQLDLKDYILKYKYECEEHEVTTEDGYVLKLIRIPGSKLSPSKNGKTPVLLQHGLAGNAWSWLMFSNNRSLAFKLANEGFDVFLGNNRGNQYSIKHTNLSRNDSAYWDFSIHELGQYDVPAMIDAILNLTGKPDLYYVGHSLGTTQYMIAMSTRPEYNKKVRLGFLLATAGYMSRIKDLGLGFAIMSTPQFDADRANLEPSMDMRKLSSLADFAANATCFLFPTCDTCDLMSVKLYGFNPNQNDLTTVRFFNAKYFSTTSTKIFGHLNQFMAFHRFHHYDMGSDEANKEKYGKMRPPPYPIWKIKTPTVGFWGYSDTVVVKEDVKKTAILFEEGVIKENNRVAIKSFNHLDFLIANDVERYVTDRIVWIMKTGKYL